MTEAEKAEVEKVFRATFSNTKLNSRGELRVKLSILLGPKFMDPPWDNPNYKALCEATEGMSLRECQHWLAKGRIGGLVMTVVMRLKL